MRQGDVSPSGGSSRNEKSPCQAVLHEASGHQVKQANDISFTGGLGPSQELEGFQLGRPQIPVPCQVPREARERGQIGQVGR